jgi:hypothetical protein
MRRTSARGCRRARSRWRAGPVAGHGLRLRRLRLRGVSRATRSRIVLARPGAIAVLRSVNVYSFAAAAPVVRPCAGALRPRIAPPWSASALASQRVRPHLSTVECRRTVRVLREARLLLTRGSRREGSASRRCRFATEASASLRRLETLAARPVRAAAHQSVAIGARPLRMRLGHLLNRHFDPLLARAWPR